MHWAQYYTGRNDITSQSKEKNYAYNFFRPRRRFWISSPWFFTSHSQTFSLPTWNAILYQQFMLKPENESFYINLQFWSVLFKRGIFQGDPLSPVIFLMVFNPIIELLQKEIKHGFDLEGDKCITLPYFCLITTNKKTHQRIMDLINSEIQSQGMKPKHWMPIFLNNIRNA